MTMSWKNFLLGLICFILVTKSENQGFVTTNGTEFVVNGEKFRFGGTNCYYLTYQDEYMVDNVLDTAMTEGFNVIRIWAFIDVGYPNGSASADSNYPLKNGLYFQYWDEDTQQPAQNDEDLKHLDYVLYKANENNIRIILTLTNNWSDFGGMDQYIMWKRLADTSYKGYHDDFYVDNQLITWYQNWINYIANRVNSYNNVVYKNDPTIFAWELANEPRCQGSGDNSISSTGKCTLNYAVYETQPVAWKIGDWVYYLSAYIKSVDSNHMVATGDEGFYCDIYQLCGHTWCDCYYGTDAVNFTSFDTIDYMSLHLYPDQWGEQNNWGNWWIANHTAEAALLNKPAMMGEYGAKNGQSQVYENWTDTIYNSGMAGDLFWMISGVNDQDSVNGYWVPNYDGYAVYCPNSTEPTPPGDINSCPVLSQAAAKMRQS